MPEFREFGGHACDAIGLLEAGVADTCDADGAPEEWGDRRVGEECVGDAVEVDFTMAALYGIGRFADSDPLVVLGINT